MKNLFKTMLVCTLLTANTLSARADYDFKVNNLYYKFQSIEKRTCIVCNQKGGWTSQESEYSGNIVIPDNVIYNNASLTVVGVDEYAFYKSSISSITLPNTIEKISGAAFNGCKNLTKVKLPSGIKVIGPFAFANCTSITSINIPDNCRIIGESAFQDCEKLRGLFVIPPSCHSIGDYAFWTGDALCKFSIPNRKQSIALGIGCFAASDSLYIDTEVENIASVYDATKVVFGDQVMNMPSIPKYLEGRNRKLLQIGGNINYVPFLEINIMQAIYMRNPNPPLAEGFTDKTYANATVYVPKGSKANYEKAPAWKNFFSIKEYDVQLPSNIKKKQTINIDGYECVKVGNLYWRTNNVGASAPYELGKTYIKCLKDSIKSWQQKGWRLPTLTELRSVFQTWTDKRQDGKFYHVIKVNNNYCYQAEKADLLLPMINNLYQLEEHYVVKENVQYNTPTDPFYHQGHSYFRLVMDEPTYTNKMSDIQNNFIQTYETHKEQGLQNSIPDGATEVSIAAFRNRQDITEIIIPNTIVYIWSSAFEGCSAITKIAIPNSVTYIGDYAFRNCSSLVSIIIPNSVSKIGDSAFSGCTNLKSITIPNSITSIETGTFAECSSLRSVFIPNSIISIAGGAFYGCESLEKIVIPNSVKTIGKYAFRGCRNLNIRLPKRFQGQVELSKCKSVEYY